MLSWTGGWLKGRAQSDSFVTVVAWSAVPSICSVFLIIPRLLIFGEDPFYFDIQVQGLFKVIAFALMAVIGIGLSIWTLVILIQGIAIVQQFNLKKAAVNALLPVLVIAIPIFIIAGLIYVF